MTERRDLKRRVRERQAQTGESYMTALRHVRGQRTSTVPVVELIDISEIGALLGIKCRVLVQPELAERVDVAAMLRQLHAMLISARRDPDAWLMRAVVLHGERPFSSPSSFGSGAEFRRRLRSGLAGISEDGRLLALPTAGRDADELAICMLWMSPVRYIDIRPSLIITSSSALAADRWVAVPLIGALMGLP